MNKNRERTSHTIIWMIQYFCVILLIAVVCTEFRYSDDVYFHDGIRGIPYEASESFQSKVTDHVSEMMRFLELQSIFETNGRPDRDKVVQVTTDSEGKEHSYTLQDVVDFGKAIGIYFDAENRMIVRNAENGNNEEPGTENSAHATEVPGENTEEEWEEVLPEVSEENLSENDANPVFNLDNYEAALAQGNPGNTEDSRICMALLAQLADYYMYQRNFGNGESRKTNFLFRMIVMDASGNALVSTNAGEELNRETVTEMGSYLWVSSSGDVNSSMPENLTKELRQIVSRSEFLQDCQYDLLLAVDNSYPIQDMYSRDRNQYEHFVPMVRMMTLLEGILLAAMVLSIIALTVLGRQTFLASDRWFSEVTILGVLGLGAIAYWGVIEILYAFQTRSVIDLITGISLFVLGYLPGVFGVLSIVRRIRWKHFFREFLVVSIVRSLEENYQHRRDRIQSFRKIRILVMYQVANVLFTGTAIHLILQRSWWFGIPCAILTFALNGIFLGWVSRRELQQGRIFERIREMSEGKIGVKMDSSDMETDIRRQAELVNDLDESLEKAVQARTRSERMQTNLIANVSHDLRTPLTSILNYIGLLRREPLPEGRVQEYLDVLESKSNRLKSLAEALMDASRATSGNLTIHWELIDMVEMQYQVIGEFLDRFEEKNLEPVVTMVKPPARIRADGRILWRVFDNLYSNACKYAMPHSQVYIDVRETSHSLIFTMRNLSARPLELSADDLMERFIRGDSSRTTEGSGLGLAIARSMTEQLHGRFELVVDGDYFRVRLVFPRAEE